MSPSDEPARDDPVDAESERTEERKDVMMNDFLLAELAREHNARLAREAAIERLLRSAEGARERPSRRRGRRLHPRNG